MEYKPRFCEACGKELVRRQGPNSMETNSRFLTRKYCNYACSKPGRTIDRHDPPIYCITCGKELVRQKTKNGKLETATSFKYRRFCNAECIANRIRSGETDRPVPHGPIPCRHCGKMFNSGHIPGRFCSQECFGLHKRGKSAKDVAIQKSRVAASQLVNRVSCNRCGATSDEAKIVTHHIDENPENNSVDNLEALCRACHARHHGTVLDSQKCQVCGKPRSTKWKDVGVMCEKHYNRYRLYGSPHLKKNSKQEIVECQD